MAFGWAAIGCGASAHAHRNYTAPDLAVTCKIGAKALLCGVVLPARVMGQVLGDAPQFNDIPTHDEQIALRDGLLSVFKAHNPVRIDGVRVQPELRSTTLLIKLPHDALESSGAAAQGVTLHASDANVARLIFGYPFAKATLPARIDMIWDLEAAYTTTSPDARGEPRLPTVPVSFLHDGKWQRFSFSPDEPQHIWHAPRTVGPPPVPMPRAAQAATVRVPLIAAIILCVGLLVLVMLRGKRLAVLALMLVGAVATWTLKPIDVALPWTTQAAPDAPEAQAIFKGLHARIYRAFDQESEPAIYDALAEAVDGPLLEWLYTRIYTDLVMREQGGAVAQAEGVDVQLLEVLPAPGAAFRVRAHWQVTGTVTHWGHAHQRVNTYTAIYTIDRRDAAWKVVAVEPIEQQRSPPG
ncbi:MAG: hypothetical protein ACI9U2_002531 [Bradymonadia bacterium]